jgi:beta-lactam-binding protein with PASTA domain
MARPLPTDLEDALAASPAARDHFWALPAEGKDEWVAYVERARFPGARRRRIAETVRRLGGAPAGAAVVEEQRGPVALPSDDWSVWLIGLALLAGLAAFLVWLTVFHNKDNSAKPSAVVVTQRSTVPKVTGIRYQSAQFQLQDAKLTSTLTQKNSTKPKGIVIAQSPDSGKSVLQGTQVALVVSKGPSGVAMPDVTGMAAADAVKALAARKLVPTLQQVDSQEAPGTVLAQSPTSGKRAKPGTKVTLQVAKGHASIAVPDVTGHSAQDAVNDLKNAGLSSTVVRVPASQPTGTVVAQSPAAGTKVARGSAVRLNVAQARAATTTAQQTTTAATTTAKTTTTTKPPASGNDYTGMKLNDAVQQIADGRQQVIVEYVTSSEPAGVVVSNSRSGSKERLQVSNGPKPKPARSVPDTTGEDAQTAQQDLQSAGFTVIQVTWPVSDASSDGTVVYQTPSAGSSAPQGSAIVVYVGSASGG